MRNSEDKLFYLFTAFLQRHIQGARLNFFRKVYEWQHEIPIADWEVLRRSEADQGIDSFLYTGEFAFEEERLVRAFQDLPRRRQMLLEYLFIHDLTPKEISILLGCSVDYVYHLKHYALNALRKALKEEDDEL